ncbi:MAG: response regulator [Lachnospiraceae bacterium]|nr:response regulator [Lachnospiraceae bacterium]
MFKEEELVVFAEGKSILLMEDNEINAQIAESQLVPMGFNVEWAENGRMGLEMFLGSEENHFCCIITDIMMPEMDGFEAASNIRKSGRSDAKIPVLGVTANTYAEKEVKGNKDINQFITKPYKRNDLIEWICNDVMSYEAINDKDR